MKTFALSLLFVLLSLGIYAQDEDEMDPELDSLISLYHTLDYNDTTRLSVNYNISKIHYSVDSTVMWSNRLLDDSYRFKKPSYRIDALGFLSWAYFYQDKYDESVKLCFNGLLLCDSINDESQKSYLCYMLSSNYSYMLDYEKADNYAHQALELATRLRDTTDILQILIIMADNYVEMKSYSMADKCYQRCFELDSMLQDSARLYSHLLAFSETKLTKYSRQFDSVDVNLFLDAKRLLLDKVLPNQEVLDYNHKYLANYLMLRAMFYEFQHYAYTGSRHKNLADSMYSYYLDCQKNVNLMGAEDAEFLSKLQLSNYCIVAQNFKRARQILDSLELIAADYPSEYGNFLEVFHYYYMAIGDYKNALKYQNKFFDDLYNSDDINLAVKTAQSMAEAEFKEIQRQDELKHERNKAIALGVSILVLIIVAGLVWEYFRKRRHNMELSEKNLMLIQQKEEILSQKEEIQAQSDELLEQNDIITQKNKSITDSIRYASLIQQAVLPADAVMKSMFSDYFLIYRPLHIVAGDFYWASRMDKYKILVCADCTGHGVPGAFVSMLGVSLLNDIVPQVVYNHGNAADILNELRTQLMKCLGQDKRLYEEGKRSNMDGMDLSLIMIEDGTMNLQYAGAYRPLWLWRQGELTQYKPDKMPIGLYLGAVKNFSNQEILLQPGDILYMFSDGIPDQFGYIDDERVKCKHFSTKRFAALLTEIGSQPMQEQKLRVENEVDTFKNGYKQLDDNILLAVKI